MSKITTPSEKNNPTPLQGLVWNKDLTLDDVSQGVALRRSAIEEARNNRPRTAQIEKEIMIAVVILYALILGSFAGLHLYASYNSEIELDESAVVIAGE